MFRWNSILHRCRFPGNSHLTVCFLIFTKKSFIGKIYAQCTHWRGNEDCQDCYREDKLSAGQSHCQWYGANRRLYCRLWKVRNHTEEALFQAQGCADKADCHTGCPEEEGNQYHPFRRKKADAFCENKITEVISLISGLGFPWENFIPAAHYISLPSICKPVF